MPPNADPPITSVLLIDRSRNQRRYWADELKRVSHDYLIVEAEDRETGLSVFRSRPFDCVVLELALGDQSGFQLCDRPRSKREQSKSCGSCTHPYDTEWGVGVSQTQWCPWLFGQGIHNRGRFGSSHSTCGGICRTDAKRGSPPTSLAGGGQTGFLSLSHE